MSKLKTFKIMGRLEIECDISIHADDLEDALHQARMMKEEDFIKIHGEYITGGMSIIGVYENIENY